MKKSIGEKHINGLNKAAANNESWPAETAAAERNAKASAIISAKT
jgi:hypothetical protein